MLSEEISDGIFTKGEAMDLNAVKVFIAVVQVGSLSKACEKLAMPIATVSRYISGLEKDLNVQLFDRFKTGVKPTALGQQFYEQVHLSMDNLLNAPQILQDNQQHLKGTTTFYAIDV